MEFYRYENHARHFGEEVEEFKFVLLRETPKGYWIIEEHMARYGEHESYKKWIPKRSKKRYAYPTKEEAMENFKRRKKSEWNFIMGRLYRNEIAQRKIGIEPPKRDSFVPPSFDREEF